MKKVNSWALLYWLTGMYTACSTVSTAFHLQKFSWTWVASVFQHLIVYTVHDFWRSESMRRPPGKSIELLVGPVSTTADTDETALR